MAQTADGARQAQSAPESEEGDSPGDQGGPRGFFHRLFDALSGNEAGNASAAPAGPSAALLRGLGNLGRLKVEEVAVPKVEIVAVPATIGRDELVEVFREHGFSRLPVYKGTLDSPLGMIHLKDLALEHGFTASPPGRFSVRKLLRPLLYVPPSMPIGMLLQKMQRERRHMALVIDEYGGVDGLVTIEDLIEQVLGQIEDEHDEEDDALWILEQPGQYLVQARAPLRDFEAETGIRLSEEEAGEIDTLGGLVFMLADRVPARGELIRHGSGAEFEVLDADPRRIKRLRLRLPEALLPAARAAPEEPAETPASNVAAGALAPRGEASGGEASGDPRSSEPGR